MKPREGGLRRTWEKGEREQTTNKRGYIIERPKDCRARATWIEPLCWTLKSEIEKWWRVLNFAAHKSFLGSTWALRQWFVFCIQGLTEFLFRISLMMYLSIIKGMRQKLLWWLNGYVIFLYVIHSEDVESSNPHGHTNLVWIIHVTVTNVFRTDVFVSRNAPTVTARFPSRSTSILQWRVNLETVFRDRWSCLWIEREDDR